jgi:hypothetical protein
MTDQTPTPFIGAYKNCLVWACYRVDNYIVFAHLDTPHTGRVEPFNCRVDSALIIVGTRWQHRQSAELMRVSGFSVDKQNRVMVDHADVDMKPSGSEFLLAEFLSDWKPIEVAQATRLFDNSVWRTSEEIP